MISLVQRESHDLRPEVSIRLRESLSMLQSEHFRRVEEVVGAPVVKQLVPLSLNM